MTQGSSTVMGTGRDQDGEVWTVLRLMRWSGEYLEEKGVERGRLDAEHLLGHALGVPRLQLYLQFDRPLDAEELDLFRPLLRRRARREPLQYILGRAAFRGLELRVDPRVLIPRPETEVLVDEVHAEGAIARSFADAPEIDGLVHIRDGQSLQAGMAAKVLIEDSDDHDLFGRLSTD